MGTYGSACASIPSPSLSLRAETLDPTHIPVIDFGCLNHPHPHHLTAARSLVIQDIKRACQNLGCFQVINHGINKSVITGALEAASDFFQLSTEEKAEFASDDITKPVRYSGGSSNSPRAFLKHYAHPLSEWVQFWPLDPPDYRKKMGKYAVEARRVAIQLMDAILEGLGLGEAYLSEELEEGMHVLAVNSYQQHSDPPESVLGFGAHSDYGCLTIQIQSCHGLQVIDNDVEGWRSVPDSPEAVHVHIGDYLEVLSNGRYKGTVHRAIIDTQKRISIASIHSLSMDEMVTTPDELVDEQHPKGYRDSSFRDFLDYISTNDIINGVSFIDSLRLVGA